jgi:hypothetical protein
MMMAWLLPTAALGEVGGPERDLGSRSWLLTDPARAFLSGSAETALLAQNGLLRLGRLALPPPIVEQGATHPSGGTDVRISDLTDVSSVSEGGSPHCNTQTEVSLARSGTRVLAAWVDGRQCQKLLQSWAREQAALAAAAQPPPVAGISLSGFGFSEDGGLTWKDGGELLPPEGGNLFGNPAVAAGIGGRFHYATLMGSPACCQIGVATSAAEGSSWSGVVNVSAGRHPSALQDKPWISVDRSSSAHRGSVYVAWTEWAPGESVVDAVLFSRSTDGGATFSTPLELSRPALDGAFDLAGMGTQVAVGPEGEIYVVWVDSSRSRIWFVRSLDGGATFSRPTRILKAAAAGHESPCFPGAPTRHVLNGDIRIPYNLPSLAVDTSGSSDPDAPDYNPSRGRVYVAITHDDDADDPGAAEWPFSLDESDVAFTYSSDRGSTWANTVQPSPDDPDREPTFIVNDDGSSTDQFNPQVAVDDRGRVAVSWYDRRVSVPQQSNFDLTLFAAISTDGGMTFGDNMQVGDEPFHPARANPNSNWLGGCYMGLYNGITAGSGEFLVAWGDNRDGTHVTPDLNVYLDRIALG